MNDKIESDLKQITKLSNVVLKVCDNYEKICRTCLSEKFIMLSINDAYLREMLMKISNVQVSEGDELPQFICSQCIKKLNRSFAFKELCENSDNTLRNYLLNKNQHIKIEDEHIVDINDDVIQNSSIKSNLETDADALVENIENASQSENITASESRVEETITFNCRHCKICFQEKLNLDAHIKEKHVSSQGKQSDESICGVCGRKFRSDIALGKHMPQHTGETPFCCEKCGAQFKCGSTFNSHMKHKHSKIRPYQCKICPKAFVGKAELAQHSLVHSGKKTHFCDVCGKGTTTKANLQSHMRQHTGDKPFPCDQCEWAFASNCALKWHKKRHLGIKPFSCEFCAKTYLTAFDIKKHMFVHTGERPYACKFCGKTFRITRNHKRHEKMHCPSRERNHKCSLCEKAFIYPKHLGDHMRIHNEEQPYTCQKCNQSFTQKRTLQRHMKTHDDYAATSDIPTL